ncbi:MAG: hypothetical protein HON64_06560 [Microbacteriaceae bacterium]|nr:hypothetical protein [Microbacteriaceae bacterium]
MSTSFTIARVLPQILGLNGSSASAEILGSSLRHLGYDVSIMDIHSPQDAVSDVDIVCVGSGSTSSINPGASAILGLVQLFHAWSARGAIWCAQGTGWDLLGASLTTPEGRVIPGAGVFPSEADLRAPRFSGEVAGVDYQGRDSAGYVNAIGHTTLLDPSQVLVNLSARAGEFPSEEGIVSPGLFATKIGGPALALNPHWSNDLVTAALATRGLTPEFGEYHDRVESLAQRARAKIVARLAQGSRK